jgi:ATP-dependent DNA helicase RecG
MTAKPKFDPRKMMEKAIEVMRLSVAERRADGKPNPLVGAVLVRPNGSVETAARGELREGNHAEFTLLERKCVGEKLDGGVLFATLEPCLNRNHPKRGCARHIVSARIKEVWVGIEDDNPTVAGKGIEQFRQHGVTVHMFDRDLQEIIVAENMTFFEWARQQTEMPEPEPIKLSKYEDPLGAVALGDLSEKALARYRSKAAIKPALGSAEFARLLTQQGLLKGEGDAVTPTGFGFLLFGKEPRNAVPQAGLLARAEHADGKSSRVEFGQAMVLIPGELEAWLNKVLPSTLDRSRMERRELVDLPFEMIREAVVNALIHRDYDIAGQKCQLVVNADTITIKSPGGPIAPITLEQMRSFTAPMKSRNPMLHYVFARMGMAEEQGYGLSSLKAEAEKLGLPLPSYSITVFSFD